MLFLVVIDRVGSRIGLLAAMSRPVKLVSIHKCIKGRSCVLASSEEGQVLWKFIVRVNFGSSMKMILVGTSADQGQPIF